MDQQTRPGGRHSLNKRDDRLKRLDRFRNRELTALLVRAGTNFGFQVQTELPIPGGRIDVAWLWRPTGPVPGVDGDLPVVAFEIESSWRTRKHVKGDLLNLLDLGASLGVIVLAGSGERIEALRRFTRKLANRPGPTVLVWSEEDVRALAAGGLGGTGVDSSPTSADTTPATVERVVRSWQEHSGKYRRLWTWLIARTDHEVELSFADVEGILGFPLPNSCRVHEPHWYGYEGTAVGRAIRDAGWKASRIDLGEQTLTLRRESS